MEYELLQLINYLGLSVVGFIVFYHFIGLEDAPKKAAANTVKEKAN